MERLQLVLIIPIKAPKEIIHQLKRSLSHYGFEGGIKIISLLGPYIGIKAESG